MNQQKKKKNQNGAHQKKSNKKKVTFVLCHPLVCVGSTVGAVVKEFTKLGLKLIGLRCMSVTEKFMKDHLVKEGRDIFTVKEGEDIFTREVLDLIKRGPFVAMRFKGIDAVNRASELVSKKKDHPFWAGGPLIYCSESGERAREDAAMWFSEDSSNWQEKEHLMFALPDGTKLGAPIEEFQRSTMKIDFGEFQRFILIRPAAFKDNKMPEVLSTVEKCCYDMKGLKLVRRSEVAPDSVAWSDNPSSNGIFFDKDEFGIACIVLSATIQIEESFILFKDFKEDKDEEDEDDKFVDKRVDRELIFVSEEGESLEFAKEFFKFGVVGWADPSGTGFCGGYFEPTLTGLVF